MYFFSTSGSDSMIVETYSVLKVGVGDKVDGSAKQLKENSELSRQFSFQERNIDTKLVRVTPSP